MNEKKIKSFRPDEKGHPVKLGLLPGQDFVSPFNICSSDKFSLLYCSSDTSRRKNKNSVKIRVFFQSTKKKKILVRNCGCPKGSSHGTPSPPGSQLNLLMTSRIGKHTACFRSKDEQKCTGTLSEICLTLGWSRENPEFSRGVQTRGK